MSNLNFDPRKTSYFHDNAANNSVVEHGIFSNNSINNGTILGVACFVDNSQNNGVVHGDAYVGTMAIVPTSSVHGTIYNAGIPLNGYTTCDPNNRTSLILYINHEDTLTHGTYLYKYPNGKSIFHREIYESVDEMIKIRDEVIDTFFKKKSGNPFFYE